MAEHRADKQFTVEYSYAGSDWSVVVWANDLADAQTKLRALQTNGRVIGEIHARIAVPNWLGRLLIRFGFVSDKENG